MTALRVEEVARFDKGAIRGEAYVTDEGYIKANAVVTRTGVFLYKNPDGSLRRELRHPDEVLKEDSLATMKMIPVTNGHPTSRLVSAENAKELAIGYTGETVSLDNQYILANFLITDIDGVKDVIENDKKELSLGYTVDLVPEEGDYFGEPYDFRQTNIKYNHLSLVNTARAGPEARIALDEGDAEEIEKEEKKMTKKKVRIRGDDYFMEPEAAEGVERLQEDLKNLEDEKRRVEGEIERIRAELEKSNGERDKVTAERDNMRDKLGGMQEEIDKKMDAAEIQKRVKERLKLYKVADRMLQKDQLAKLDDMSDLDIKKAVIRSKKSDVALDGKSDVYIQARFDAVVEDMPAQSSGTVKATPAFNKYAQGRQTADGEPDADAARAKMIGKYSQKK